MTGEDKTSWARDIHRQVYELVLILAMLVVVAAGYHLWSHVSVEQVRNNINDHHLVANSQYLRAMEELRNLQMHHTQRHETDTLQESSRWNQDFAQANNQQSVIYHLVEEAIEAATHRDDFGPFNRLVDVLSRPGEFDPANTLFAPPPMPEQILRHTVCGT